MAEVSHQASGIAVTVRYFAAAKAAAGIESETLVLPTGTTVADLVEELANRGTHLAAVLNRCSYLRDGIAVRDEASALSAGDTVDVLPPFAGG
ncbi:MoaD/ThiS family protein [Mycobacterium paragordonae]|mgnify:CR=1 FL=1|uniref:Molybdopterin synthase sulfur carrier subunit n=1 Tax=Mycobacterium paragordonae TaxID=1389713 RepID=A0A386UBR6_9MYCO|nr:MULTISPECIES: MoaD/ThiS family protein [Mycobacterium]PJE19770.1 MAG: MoaD/ThiS family protein [Mycobacterium sp.]AYE97669.1 MoaD/ThiS family protein [Mycobacterium paragordonae]MDP7738530.1 MoaD/ThiS family protein [Mycobacterium paragordonae]OBJ85116.1 molybdopterin synthase sulfur carrier subunit [Mycobacterium gordonae]OBK53039.1 molybdopterin synthase sulfur carrier subunit [Mycobacterium gordonae]